MRGSLRFRGAFPFLRERDDGSFVALDPHHNETTSSTTIDRVGEVLLERGLEPLGYFVEEGVGRDTET